MASGIVSDFPGQVSGRNSPSSAVLNAEKGRMASPRSPNARIDSKEDSLSARLRCFFESLGSSYGCRHEDPEMQPLRQEDTKYSCIRICDNIEGEAEGSSTSSQQPKGGVVPQFAGLNCNWVMESVLACARPSDAMFDDGLLDRFKEAGVAAIVNLQEHGEHPWCGPGITDSGFSYTPARLQQHGIAYIHCPWKDLGCPDMALVFTLIDQITAVASAGKKVVIHCHAGLGRTGLVIACYIVHTTHLSATEAIALVRKNRPASIQTAGQVAFVSQFEAYIRGVPAAAATSEGERVPLLPSLQPQQPGWLAYLWGLLIFFVSWLFSCFRRK